MLALQRPALSSYKIAANRVMLSKRVKLHDDVARRLLLNLPR